MNNLSSDITRLINRIAKDDDSMIQLTRQVADINSGSRNTEGLNKTHDFFDQLYLTISDEQYRLELPVIKTMNDSGIIQSFKTVDASVYRINPRASTQILCTGHTDTVFPLDSDFQKTWIEGNYLRGPGVADMKGGLITIYHAIKAILQSPYADDIGFTVLLSPDEEIGSPASAHYLSSFAKNADIGMVCEPSLEDGTLAGARKGSGNFSVSCKGHSTHAGRSFFEGKNALVALANLSVRLSSISDKDQGTTLNVGKIIGGGAVNIVPDLGVMHFNCRVDNDDQKAVALNSIQEAISEVEQSSGCKFELSGHFNRPSKPITPQQKLLFETLKDCGRKIDIDVKWRNTGGCCEGNNLAEAGLPNVDTLGVRGANIHTSDEYACIDSFVERAQLAALLMIQSPMLTKEIKRGC